MRHATLSLLLIAACAGAPAKTEVPPRTAVSAAAPADTSLHLRLTSDPEAEGRLHVEIEIPTTERTFAHEPVHSAHIEGLIARDAQGPISVERVRDRYELARAPSGTLALRYSVTFGPPEPVTALENTVDVPSRDGLSPLSEPTEFRALGRDVLLAPAKVASAPTKIEVQLRTVDKGSSGATSYGLGRDQTITAHFDDLRESLFLAGDVGVASFHSVDGDDFAAWLGNTSFDPRWVSAELAGVRASIDRWMGRAISPGTPPVSMLFTVNRSSDPPVIVRSAPRGFIVAVDRHAPWSPSALLLATQAMTQRYIGGFLRVEAGEFFPSGFSRAIARDILEGMALFGPEQRATEMNALLATLVFAADQRALTTARGALAATSLDAAIRARSKGERSLRTFIRGLLADAASTGRTTVPRFTFLSKIAEATDQSTADYFDLVVEHEAEADLPADLLAPCHRLVQKDLVAFDLGFTGTKANASGDTLKVESVKKFSRAEAAGLRAGDLITNVKYERGKSSVPVELSTTRDGRPVTLKFMPAGATKPGRVFERMPNAPAERCRG